MAGTANERLGRCPGTDPSRLVRLDAPTAMLVLFAFLFWPWAETASAADRPQRIVSINLCTDQLLMMLADRTRIAAVSHLARDATNSVLARTAAALPVTHAQAEEVYVLKPDLVVASTFTSPATIGILKRLGVNVVQFAPASSFADIRARLRQMGDLIGERAKADRLVAQFDSDLQRYEDDAPGRRPLAAFYYANAYTSGGETIAGEVLEAAGLRNLGEELGLRHTSKLALEQLVMANPDLVIAGRVFEPPALAQEILRHPAVKFLQARSEEVSIADKYTVCGTPLVLEAVERLAQVRRRLNRREAARLDAAAASVPDSGDLGR